MKHLTFTKLRNRNLKRNRDYYPGDMDRPYSFWTNALAGECGELCNWVKKLERGGHSKRKEKQLKLEIRKEIGDLQTYLDLVAARFDFSLEEVTIEKFNEVSDRFKCKIKL